MRLGLVDHRALPDQPAVATLQHIALGDAHAQQTRDTVALKLTAEQISEAQKIVLDHHAFQASNRALALAKYA